MTRPVYSFRPNLKNPEHQRAWEKFQSVPEGQKSQYLVQAILEKEDRKWLIFYLKWKICKGGEAYDCTIHTLLDLLGARQEMHRYLWWVL